jgi:hypothetical protein
MSSIIDIDTILVQMSLIGDIIGPSTRMSPIDDNWDHIQPSAPQRVLLRSAQIAGRLEC